MDVLIDFSTAVDVEIQLPASKSISNRVLIIRAVSGENVPIENLAECDDTDVLLHALDSRNHTIDIGAAGTAMRFLTAYFAQKPHCECRLTGSERMKQRPIRLLVDALCDLGANINYAEQGGFPPIDVVGKQLEGGKIRLKGDVSSQYVSALMMIAPMMKNGLRIELIPPVISQPYIALTRQLMQTFGVDVSEEENVLEIASSRYQMHPYVVESDWSAASYWYEILALRGKGEYFLRGLTNKGLQGDSKLAELFLALGVSSTFEDEGVRIVATGERVARMEYNFVNQPDLAQTFVVTCCFLGIPFCFSGLGSLKIKETDRIFALRTELAKFGFEVCEPENGVLAWNGVRSEMQNSIISVATYNDHRMAMAFAPIALQQPIKIEHKEVVSKSYPTYWKDLEKAGFHIFYKK